MKKVQKFILMIAACALVLTMTGCESMSRAKKSFRSDIYGGLDRTVTLYSNTGEEIKSWSGKFDVSDSENEVFFDLDGKRVIIHGGIVVNEEE